MSTPWVQPRITYRDLCALPDDGHRYELVDGEAFIVPSPSLRHQILLQRLETAFLAALDGRSRVIVAPMDVVLGEATSFQPDLILVLERSRAILKTVVEGAPDLVAEVLSPSTERRDRGLKPEMYARHGIGEYWIVDDEAGAVEIHRREPGGRNYGAPVVLREGEAATTPLLPRLALDLTALFGARR